MPSSSPAWSARIVLLLAAAVFLNYFDRGTLSTAAPLLQQDLALNNVEMGILLSAFFWSYAPMQPLAGWLAQRFDVRQVLACGLALWAAATILTGFAGGFVAILCLRILLGIGESVAYPCNAKFLGQRVPLATRGRANGFIATGQALGPMLGTLLGGLIMEAHGWRPAFLLFGAVSLLWLLPWLVTTRGGLTAPEAMHARPLPYRVLLRERALWGTSLGHFCSNYAYYFMLTWLPVVLVRDRGFTLAEMAVIGAAVYALQGLSAPLTGWLCDRAIARGAAPERVLKGTMNAALLAVAIAMAGCAYAGREATVALILVAGVFFGVQSAPLGTITQTLGGPRAAGQWMGVQNLCANMAGVIAPVLTGAVVDLSGNFVTAFAIAAGVTLLGTLAYGVVIQRVEPVAWPAARP
jgi:MFS family permease